MNNIGDRIKQKRKELGFTQAELGEKLNITDRAVSKWEQGEGDPNLSIIPDIAKALGVSLDYLLLGKEEEPAITLDDMDAEKRLSLLIKRMMPRILRNINIKNPRMFLVELCTMGAIITLNIRNLTLKHG